MAPDFRELFTGISIHAPREGSDLRNKMCSYSATISIHAPREGSDFWPYQDTAEDEEFLSTLPARGATRDRKEGNTMNCISIHAPREGSDLLRHQRRPKAVLISIHAPREGSDAASQRCAGFP